MFDQPPPSVSRKGPLRLIAVSAVLALIGIGLCGALPPALKGGTDDLGRLMLGAVFICSAAIGLLWGFIWLAMRSGSKKGEE
jgi:hypothetical protein